MVTLLILGGLLRPSERIGDVLVVIERDKLRLLVLMHWMRLK